MRIGHELLRRLVDAGDRRKEEPGWAGRSLEGSITRALLIGVASWQGIMVLAALFSLGFAPVGLAVALGHLVAIVAALAVLRTGRGHLSLILWAWALFVVDWAVAPTPESTLLFAACWMCNLTSCLPAFVLRGRASWCAPLAATVTLPLLLVVVRPDLAGHPLVGADAVTLVAITVATRIGLSFVVDYTDGVDAEARALEEKAAALATRRTATHQAAEDARVLHDTPINTLGAIANGGAALNDAEAVRRRCLADIAAIEDLRSHAGGPPAARPRFRDAIVPAGIRVRYAGLSDDELARTEALLPPGVVRAFSRAMAEAVQNAAKHSGADEVIVSVTHTADGVRAVVSDGGVGIQGDPQQGSGIRHSILERAREAGIGAAIHSAPGQGTRVTLEYAFGSAADAPTAGPVAATVEGLVSQLRWRSVYALSAGLAGVGVVLSAANHPGQPTPEWLMTAVVAAACWLAWRERDRARLSVTTVLALIAAGPLAFVLSAWAVGFGRIDPTLWQAIAPTGPLMVLMIVPLPRAVKVLALTAYLLSVGLTAAGVAPVSTEAASVTLVAGLTGIGLVIGVLGFIRSLAAVATRAHLEQQEAFGLGLELAAVEAAAEARRRWRDVGLEESVRLLRAIGEGQVALHDPALRQRCAAEEAFLRQLTLLDPALTRMGTWFARALNASRMKGVGLEVRAGSTDASADAARQLGATLLTVVDAMPPGTKLTTALFATTSGLTMTLVAPTPHLVTALDGGQGRARVQKLQTLGRQDLAELVVAGSGS